MDAHGNNGRAHATPPPRTEAAGDHRPRGRRAVVLVIDACGAGALPDAGLYGDEGANTLVHLADAVGGLQLPTLAALGLGSILALAGVPPSPEPVIHGRLHALGPGKDSTAGHWELMGVVAPEPAPTYPKGFPPDVVARLEAAVERPIICNRPYNGVAAIEDFGAEHIRDGGLILYTSADSVAQLAAHVELVPTEELHGEHAVSRGLTRPFTGRAGEFSRIDGRRDFALAPPSRSYLQELCDAGVPTHGVGKIADLFAGVGVEHSHPGSTNERALASTRELLAELDEGLIFVNLVETDQLYGHRKDVTGFHHALQAIDGEVGSWLGDLGEGDLLVITADHGVDPAHPATDHTREHAPLLAATGSMLRARGLSPQRVGVASARQGTSGGTLDLGAIPELDEAFERGDLAELDEAEAATRHDGPLADVGASTLRWLAGRDAPELPGEPFVC
jgi:phosphopentomutase